MRPPKFGHGDRAHLRSSTSVDVFVIDLSPPPFQALGSSEPYYLVAPFEEITVLDRNEFVVAESDLEPIRRRPH